MTRKLNILVEMLISTNGLGGCSDSCPHLRGLGREYSCTLFERPLLVDVNVTPGRPLRCEGCRNAERNTPQNTRKVTR